MSLMKYNNEDKTMRLQRGRFKKKLYYDWLISNGQEDQVLLHKLNHDWPEKFDRTDEITVEPDTGVFFIYDVTEGKSLVRYRIDESWIKWEDAI